MDNLTAARGSGEFATAAMERIVKAFTPSAKAIANGLTMQPDVRDDALGAALLELVRAVKRHRLGQPGFPAYAKTCMWKEALREVRRCGPQPINIAWSKTSMAPEPATFELEDSDWGYGEVATAVAALAPRQQALLWRRYGEDEALSALADRAGSSESAISQRLRTAHRAVARQPAA